MEVGVSFAVVADLERLRFCRLVLERSEIDGVCAQGDVHGCRGVLGPLEFSLDTETRLLELGVVVVLDTDSHHSEDGFVVGSTQFHHVVVRLHVHVLQLGSVADAVEDAVAPGGRATLLSLLLVVAGGILLVLVGGWELEFGLHEVLEGESGALRDTELVLLEEEGEVVAGVVEDLERGDVGSDAVVEVANLRLTRWTRLPRRRTGGRGCRSCRLRV